MINLFNLLPTVEKLSSNCEITSNPTSKSHNFYHETLRHEIDEKKESYQDKFDISQIIFTWS